MGALRREYQVHFSRPRFELKFVARLAEARAFLKRLGDAVLCDPHAPGGAYQVTSLYCDTAGFRAYREKLDGVDPRYKLRVRHYGPAPGGAGKNADATTPSAPTRSADPRADASPAAGRSGAAYLEAKYRRDQRVSKVRLPLPLSWLPRLREEQVLRLDLRRIAKPSDLADADHLEGLLLDHAYAPTVTVAYVRRPYLLRLDPRIRITLDSDLFALGPAGFRGTDPSSGRRFLPPHLCVVEIKYNWSLPLWIQEEARASGLQLRRFSKYASALEAVYPDITDRELRLESLAARSEKPWW